MRKLGSLGVIVVAVVVVVVVVGVVVVAAVCERDWGGVWVCECEGECEGED